MGNQITTIQIRENVKKSLENLKERANESYEEVIVKILREKEKNKKELEKLLIEGCKEMAQDMIRINKEWEGIDAEMDWEW
jgi:predicted CopG family antitoxin